MDVTVVVATFGSDEWADLAQDRAVPSAAGQAPVIHVHAGSLHEARNAGLTRVRSEFVIYLDADDELEAGYVEAMSRAVADVRVPAVRYMRGGRARPARIPRVYNHDHDCTADCLPDGNWIVIGAAVRTSVLRAAGGWHDFPVYEDWATWATCYRNGATFARVPGAVYRAHVRADSRNRAPAADVKLAAHRAIERLVWPDRAAA